MAVAKERYVCDVTNCGAEVLSACGLAIKGTCRECNTGVMRRARVDIDGRLEITHLPDGRVSVLARRGYETITVTMKKDAAQAFARAMLGK